MYNITSLSPIDQLLRSNSNGYSPSNNITTPHVTRYDHNQVYNNTYYYIPVSFFFALSFSFSLPFFKKIFKKLKRDRFSYNFDGNEQLQGNVSSKGVNGNSNNNVNVNTNSNMSIIINNNANSNNNTNSKDAKKREMTSKASTKKEKQQKTNGMEPLAATSANVNSPEWSPLPPPPPLMSDDEEGLEPLQKRGASKNELRVDCINIDELSNGLGISDRNNNNINNGNISSQNKKQDRKQSQPQRQTYKENDDQPHQSNKIKRSQPHENKEKEGKQKDYNCKHGDGGTYINPIIPPICNFCVQKKAKNIFISKDKDGITKGHASEERRRLRDIEAMGSNRFGSRNNDLRRRPVSGISLALQQKMHCKHCKSTAVNGNCGADDLNDNENSHLKLISHKDTTKTREQFNFLKNALRREVLFDGLEKEVIRDIVKHMYKIPCNVKDIIIRQGEYGDAYFVVESGKFDVIHQENPGCPPKVVGECSAGDTFGEGSLLFSIPRAATLQAVTSALVWALDSNKFVEIRQKLTKEKNEKVARMVNFLKGIELFSCENFLLKKNRIQTFDEHDIGQIAQAIKARNYTKDEVIVREGEESNEFFVIRKGTAEVHKRNETSGEVQLLETRLKEGDFFGERGILLNTKRAATIVAASSTRCYIIQAADFKNLMEVPLQEKLDAQMNKYDQLNSELSQKSLAMAYQAQENTSLNKASPSFSNRIGCRLEDLEDIGVLGVGSFGRVSLVRDPHTSKTYSLKKIRKNQVVETGQQEHVRNERDVLAGLDCNFCCKMYATYQDRLHVYFLMEAVLGGELFTVLRWNKRFSEKTARFYTACVVLAFEHLHSKNIIYRDLKPENVRFFFF
ncbi:cGMP-dependent protein kinase 2-like isoform 1 [Reticulomyxa filosa]|uniref:cGMP-dependent protein kinase 2-like isoform 1 n=1 Tax=Reticulomyxa filosa TaxID=46433 RepID=X6P9J3_RETFI|nr:cGMP-dependent protein kinase 2-like isoform 1 [Reticulomyxa filosa]|eukprot:ETO34788.1 cGMP-dependent protein kinase 2-like isoform 1 [Reticulomyxa filosa]